MNWVPERKIAAALVAALVIAAISWALGWDVGPGDLLGLVLTVVGVGYVVPSKEI